MKYGATPLIRMLGPKRRSSGTMPFVPSVPGGVFGPRSPGPAECSAGRVACTAELTFTGRQRARAAAS